MKWMNAVVCAALLAMAGPAFSEGAPAESPRDYAYGLSLDTSASSPWYRVMLPLAVYQQSTSPDLRDVRVKAAWDVIEPERMALDRAVTMPLVEGEWNRVW